MLLAGKTILRPPRCRRPRTVRPPVDHQPLVWRHRDRRDRMVRSNPHVRRPRHEPRDADGGSRWCADRSGCHRIWRGGIVARRHRPIGNGRGRTSRLLRSRGPLAVARRLHRGDAADGPPVSTLPDLFHAVRDGQRHWRAGSSSPHDHALRNRGRRPVRARRARCVGAGRPAGALDQPGLLRRGRPTARRPGCTSPHSSVAPRAALPASASRHSRSRSSRHSHSGRSSAPSGALPGLYTALLMPMMFLSIVMSPTGAALGSSSDRISMPCARCSGSS